MAQDIIVFTAINEVDLAQEIVTELLGKDLIKSGTIFPSVQLLYKWSGTINMDDEVKLMLKTTSDKYDAVEEFIAREHPYDFPEIIRVDASFGSKNFFKLIDERKTSP